MIDPPIATPDILVALAILWGFCTLACAAALALDYPRATRRRWVPTKNHRKGNWR